MKKVKCKILKQLYTGYMSTAELQPGKSLCCFKLITLCAYKRPSNTTEDFKNGNNRLE